MNGKHAVIDWWLAPLSGAATHAIAPWAAWHARLMVLAWGVLVPLGVLAARFYKVTPQQRWPQQLDNPAWWHTHRAAQYSGVLLMSVGAALAWSQGQGLTTAARVHAWLGWGVVAAGWLQVLGGWARGSKGGPTDAQLRGDHFDMTPRRVAFERGHKTLGYAALAAAAAAIGLGLFVSDAPRWMPGVLLVFWAALAVAFVRLQRAGRCIDTYQAIWGLDMRMPGNGRTPIGVGIRRRLP